MITAVLIIATAFRTNKSFNPELLFVGTLIADVMIFGAMFGG